MKTLYLAIIIVVIGIVAIESSFNITFAQNVTYSSNPIQTIPSLTLHSPVPTLSSSGNQSVVNVALSIPELQKWSHNWQYVHTAFLGNNKAGTAGFEWQYAMVYLKTPPNSGLIPCDIGWDAEVTVDMTTMKVISASYPTMNSQCHGVVITGGGPPNVQPPLSPLQQELAAYSIQKEKHAEEEKQAKDISDAIILAEVGIPITTGISVGVLLFSRKRK